MQRTKRRRQKSMMIIYHHFRTSLYPLESCHLTRRSLHFTQNTILLRLCDIVLRRLLNSHRLPTRRALPREVDGRPRILKFSHLPILCLGHGEEHLYSAEVRMVVGSCWSDKFPFFCCSCHMLNPSNVVIRISLPLQSALPGSSIPTVLTTSFTHSSFVL
jgi:hypothetical protein